MGDRNFCPLQENRKGQKTGIKEGKRILVTDSVEGRESYDLRSDLTKGPESPPWSLVPHLPRQILFEFAQVPRSKQTKRTPSKMAQTIVGGSETEL